MKINDLLHDTQIEFRQILSECSQFISESQKLPVYRALPTTYGEMRKVKVRKQKSTSFTEAYNRAFNDQHPDLVQRSIVANGNPSSLVLEEDVAGYLVYPIDGYKFMYTAEVTDTIEQHKDVFESIGDSGVFSEMLSFSYSNENLHEGIQLGSEILLFNIPHYYAIQDNDRNRELLTSIDAL